MMVNAVKLIWYRRAGGEIVPQRSVGVGCKHRVCICVNHRQPREGGGKGVVKKRS